MNRRLLSIVSLLLVMALLLAFVEIGACPTALHAEETSLTTPTASVDQWLTFVEPTYNLSFRHPANWYVFAGYLQGRHRGFDAILVSSFPVAKETYGRGLGIPKKGAAMLIAFEGNDLAPGQPLEDYVNRKLASIFFQPTGNISQVGGKPFVELAGEIGTKWITKQGANVYSTFRYAENDPAYDGTILEIMGSLQLLQDSPISIPADALGLSANPGVIVSPQSAEATEVTLPNMLMPWAASDGVKQFTGGPHVEPTDNDCSALRAVSEMSGLDFGMTVGTEVLAVAGGIVVYSGDAGVPIGKAVGIDHQTGFSTRYWHLNSIDTSIKLGVSVTIGRLLGTSGYPSAPHLHLELRNLPANTSYQAHGVVIDGYTVRAYVRTLDDQGYNYQGTLTRGMETVNEITYCSTATRRWSGSEGTVVATTGGGADVTSTNIKNTGTTTLPADVALIIDSSGSMLTNDPAYKRLEAAKAYLVASLEEDRVAVVDFDDTARLLSGLLDVRIGNEINPTLRAAIDTIDSYGSTNIRDGILVACDELMQHGVAPIRGGILLTDGDHNVGEFGIPQECFAAQGWPIYTLGFGAANEVLLQTVAADTGGEYIPISDVTSLVCEFQRVRSLMAGAIPSPCTAYHVDPLSTTSFLVPVPTNQAQATFSTSWPGSDVVMSLITPSARVIDRNTTALDVIHELGTTFEAYTVLAPEEGTWEVRLYGADVPVEGEDVIFGFTTMGARGGRVYLPLVKRDRSVSRIAFVSERDGNKEIYLMNVDGTGLQRLTFNSAEDRWPAWSPNGAQIAFMSNRNGNWEVYVMNADGSGQTNLTNHSANDLSPTWSPDGQRIAFYSDRAGTDDIYLMNSDGGGQLSLTSLLGDERDPTWSPDGQRIAFRGNLDGGGVEIFVVNADGTGVTNLTLSPGADWNPSWSPDGQHIAFTSDRTGNKEIYLMNVDGTAQTNLTQHPSEDWWPAWSPDGQHISFTTNRTGNDDVFMMSPNGTSQTGLVVHPSTDHEAVWAPR